MKCAFLPPHHGEHARDSEDGRDQTCESHAPVEDEQRDDKTQYHSDGSGRIGRLVRYEPLCGASAPVDDAPERARRMGIEVAELHLHEMA